MIRHSGYVSVKAMPVNLIGNIVLAWHDANAIKKAAAMVEQTQ